MTPTEASSVNEALSRGDIDAAVAVLADKIDVRVGELPKIEKPSLAGLTKSLASSPKTQAALADAFFHPNITVRRFARKLCQTLKDDAAPLGGPLLAALDGYIRRATVMPRSFEGTPAQTKQRNEQAEVVGNVVELLFKIAPGGLIDALAGYAPDWMATIKIHQSEFAQNHAEWTAFHGVYTRKKEALWAAKSKALGITIEQVPGNLEEQWSAELEQDQEIAALRSGLKPMWAAEQPDEASLLDEGSVFRDTFNVPFYQLSTNAAYMAGPGKEIGEKLWSLAEKACGGDANAADALDILHPMCRPELASVYMGREAVVDRMTTILTAARQTGFAGSSAWIYLLHCLKEALSATLSDATAAPLPGHVTSAALAALKTAKPNTEHMIGALEAALKKREEAQAGGTATPQPEDPGAIAATESKLRLAAILTKHGAEESSFDKRWDDVRSKVASIADTLLTAEARADALIVPPKVTWEKLRGRMIEDDVDRDNLIAQWQKSPSWASERAQLAEIAGPRLIEQIKSNAAKWRESKSGKSSVGEHPDQTKWALMDAKERKIWTNNARYEQYSRLEGEVNSLTRLFLAVCGTERGLEAIEALSGDEYLPLRLQNENRLLDRWAKSFSASEPSPDRPTPEMLPVIRQTWAWRVHDNAGADDPQNLKFRLHSYAGILYQLGVDEATTEARDILSSGQLNLCYSCEFGATALARHDFDIIVPLAAHTRAGSGEKPLHELMDALAAADPARHIETAAALLAQLAVVTDKDQPAIHFELLDRIPKSSPVYTDNVATVAQGLESTLPDVVKWAMATLGELTHCAGDWETISRQAGEKLWADQPGMVKDAAKFLGTVGAARDEARATAADALGEALSLGNVALQEAILKALAAIKAKDKQLALACAPRIQELATAQPDRFGKLAAKLVG